MGKTLSNVLKSRKVSKISGYYPYSSIVDTVKDIYHQVDLLSCSYDLLLHMESTINHQAAYSGMIGQHESLDYLLLESISKKHCYPIFYVNKNLCESLYNTSPIILEEKEGLKKIPFFNVFAEKGILLMPKEINGVTPLTAAYVFKKYSDKAFYVSCLGWEIGQRGCETILLSSTNWEEVLSNPKIPSNYSSLNGIDFLINLFLYQDSVKDKMDFEPSKMQYVSKGFHIKNKSFLQPRMIGNDYKPKSIYRNNSNGENTRNSPQTHWRSGHWRRHMIGSRKNPEYKTIWIEPTLINA